MPGALPGITNYPLSPGASGASPMAGKPYEYWLLWPAPAHNSALNHLYYNPILTYATPAQPDGTAYPQMDSSYTSGWTKVPPDPFIDPDNVLSCLTNGTCVDLTAQVTVGQWCDSEWTEGNDDSGTPFVTNPGFCRANGLVAAASGGAPAADGDYSYPWAPPAGTDLKKDLAQITHNDWGWNVDFPAASIRTPPPTNAAVRPVWSSATSQDPKNFYENDNVLWCDISSPDWPQSGPTLPQTCQGLANTQTCDATSTPVCGGGVGGTCSGYVAAGTCNGSIANGTCSGYIASGKCTGYVAGACTGYQKGVCAGAKAATCNTPPTCTGGLGKSCSALSREACTGVTGACGAAPAQTCNGGTHSACSPTGTTFTCNGYQGAQTCDNHTPAPTCANQWDPPGCNTNPNPEGTCVYHPVCNTPASVYTCSIKGNSCLAADGTPGDATKCPVVNGTCQGGTNNGGACSGDANCPGTTNKCTANSAACTTSNDCPFNANSGTCNITSAACTPGGAACPAGPKTRSAGKPSTTTCTTATDCNVSGHCAVTTGTMCTSSATCPTVPLSGACNYQNNSGVASGACTSNADCKDQPNKCNNPATTTCSSISDCTPGKCATPSTRNCTKSTDCDPTSSTCTNRLKLGNICTVATDCDAIGHCSAGKPNTTTCTGAADCTVTGMCSTGDTTKSCTTTSSSDVACKKAGACTTGKVGAACSSTSTTDVACVKNGTCSNKAASCTTANQGTTCAATNGTCTAGRTGSCTTTDGSDCTLLSVCSQSASSGPGSNGSNCTTAANCTPTGQCSFDHVACTTASTCAPAGKCSTSGAMCVNDAGCPNQPGPSDPSKARCDTTGVSGNALTTLLADANGAGKTCRRNNHLYADGVTAARFNYPSGKFTTPVRDEFAAGMGCHKTDQYTSVPRHYWKTSVEWCNLQVNTAGNKWLGYGTPTPGGKCQASKDDLHGFSYPRFYQFGAAEGTDNVATPAFAREDLVDTGAANEFQHNYIDGSGDTQTITRSYADEMTNYANWFAYYRTRIQAIKTVTSLSFLGTDPTTGKFNVDDQFRVGLHTLSNDPTTTFVPVDDFAATQKTAWATQLFGLNIRMAQETPSLDAMVRIGEYFANSGSSGLSGAVDPIVLSCQKNWHMLFTDGLTDQQLLPAFTPGSDQDDMTPSVAAAPW